MSELPPELVNAALFAIKDAGFVTPIVRHKTGELLVVDAMCPCGLGASRFAHRFIERQALNVPMSAQASAVYQRFHQWGLAHIEKDKAAGRWE